jgi:polygalacturonase
LRWAAALVAALLLGASAPADSAADWAAAEAMAARIAAPRIPDRLFRAEDFGGRPDGRTDARPAILAAIGAAAKAGGGRVVLGPGVWFSKGPIRLQSRIELNVAKDATLLFSPDPADYLPPVRTRWEGTEVLTYSPLIYAADVEDVAVTGPGVIDGNPQSGFHAWARQAEPDYQRLRRMGFAGVPLRQRVFGVAAHLRPPLVQVFGGRRIRLDGYTAKNAPFWVNHLVYVDQAVVRHLRVESLHPNNDGVDVDSSTHVLVEENVFRTGDDSVVIKSGRDLDGRRIARPSAWVLVRRNDMGGEDGIALGSEMSGGIHDVFFEDNLLRKGVTAIRFKSNLDRGGTVERIRVRRMTVEDFDTLLWFQLDYPGELGGHFPSTWRNISFEDISGQEVGTLFLWKAPEESPLKDVRIRNLAVAKARTIFDIGNVEGVSFENVTVAGRPVAAPQP